MSLRMSAYASLASLFALVTLAGCGHGGANTTTTTATGGGGDLSTSGRHFVVKPGASATADMVSAMIQAGPGDVIEFGCGYFELTSSLLLSHTEDVLVKGCGKDKTVLSFKNNNAPEGILVDSVNGLTLQDLTVIDTGGNGIELRGVDHATLQRVRAMWSSGGGRASSDPITADNFADKIHVPCTHPATQSPDVPESNPANTTSPDYTVSKLSGRYGIYPVSSSNVLIEDSESIGASDAGIYIGQTNNALFRHNRAAFNVFGMEIENVQGGEYDGNLAECNTGGFLIYDIDGLRQYGDRSVMMNNISRMNNTYNFTSGGFVGNVPPGSGMITLAYDRVDIHDNEFTDNNTAGIIHTSYEIFPEGAGRPSEHRIDWYTEGLHIWHNKFNNNGNGLPLPTTTDLQTQNLAHLLPALVGAKNAAGCLLPTQAAQCVAGAALPFRGAHIIWDGLLDTYNAGCAYPLDASGNPVPHDARGKPIMTNETPDPSCHYNAYKFDTTKPAAPRVMPDWFSCIDDDNTFSSDSLAYANFHGTRGLEVVIAALSASPGPNTVLDAIKALDPVALTQFPSSFDMSPHKCVAQYGKNLPALPPVVIPPFVRSGDYDPAPSDALIAQLCGASVPAGQVNFDAAKVNCPTLDQYHLFSDAEDPTSLPNTGGTPFSLNTKLFSDYAVKYRVLFLPPGTHAVYGDAASNGVNATVVFPAGTIIAKTFSFADEAHHAETPLETRLLIKRVNSKGAAHWDGIPYTWSTENGHRVARLALGGATASVSWDTTDIDSNQHHTGSTTSYLVPNGNQCLSCHSNDDKEPGSSPIGPKIRFLNRAYRPESTFTSSRAQQPDVLGQNQIAYWCGHGIMIGCPAD
ncbi:MAG TPA: parallel beta-helix domain-containing protein, partial [Nevskiaceae bacterium]|nr:parallel beta-helix domain-containing protein [Nevskiaceae bacterium]